MSVESSNAAPAKAADYIRTAAGAHQPEKFSTGVILGSGLGSPADIAVERGGRTVRYEDIPGMPCSAVTGHAGRVVLGAGDLSGVVFLQGRVHYYEGHSLERMLFGLHTLVHLGIRTLIVTNAAGGIRSGYQPGDLMLIDGHWSMIRVQQAAADRIPGVRDCLWNSSLCDTAAMADTTLNIHRGVYAMMSGPCYETPAEIRMLKTLGVDAVGMSTIPEALAAARCGVRVLGISCITNLASGISDQPLDHSEVSDTAAGIDSEFTSWLFDVLTRL